MPTEIAWAAGFFDGEGTSYAHIQRTRGKGVLRKTPTKDLRVSLAQCEPTTIKRFLAAVGLGKMYGPYGPYVNAARPTRLPRYDYRASGAEAMEVMALLEPYLSEPKRNQWRNALENLGGDANDASI